MMEMGGLVILILLIGKIVMSAQKWTTSSSVKFSITFIKQTFIMQIILRKDQPLFPTVSVEPQRTNVFNLFQVLSLALRHSCKLRFNVIFLFCLVSMILWKSHWRNYIYIFCCNINILCSRRLWNMDWLFSSHRGLHGSQIKILRLISNSGLSRTAHALTRTEAYICARLSSFTITV